MANMVTIILDGRQTIVTESYAKRINARIERVLAPKVSIAVRNQLADTSVDVAYAAGDVARLAGNAAAAGTIVACEAISWTANRVSNMANKGSVKCEDWVLGRVEKRTKKNNQK